jgi:hypothetical protein
MINFREEELGEAFSRSDDANRLRDFLKALEENLDKIPIRGSVACNHRQPL